MGTAELLTAQVDLSGLMNVLGENLYSTPSVALRELVQNGHDACVRRRIEDSQSFEPKIVVRSDASAGILIIEDNGAGLNRDEIIQYLATIGAGYTRKLREASSDPSLIGCFGLGFLSAYVISQKLTVLTTSYQNPKVGWRFSSRTGERYTVEEIDARPVGMQITLHLKEQFRHLAEPHVLQTLLEKYCCLLSIPVYAGSADSPAVNAELPPWRLEQTEGELRKKKLKLSFAQKFERHFSPICTIDVQPQGDLCRGLLWVQDGLSYSSSDNRNLAVFVRGMLINEDVRELLPRWAGFVGGVIEAEKLTPTASREDLMKDGSYYEIETLVRDSLITGLEKIAKNDPAAWRRVLLRHNEALLGAALCDDRLFELLAHELTVPTTEGDLTLTTLRQRSQGKFFVSLSTKGTFEEILFRALKMPIAHGIRYAVLPFIKRYAEKHGCSVVQLGTKEGNQSFFREVTVDGETQKWLQEVLGVVGQKLMTTRFSPIDLPLIVVKDQDVELKKMVENDDLDKRMTTATLGLARLYTSTIKDEFESYLYINLDSPAIVALINARGESTKKAAKMLRVLAVLLGNAESSKDIDQFQNALKEYTELVCLQLQG